MPQLRLTITASFTIDKVLSPSLSQEEADEQLATITKTLRRGSGASDVVQLPWATFNVKHLLIAEIC